MSVLLQIKDLSKNFGPHVIFKNANLTLEAKQKVGVIGRNGAGKSTLFKMIVGESEYNSGQIIINEKTTLGYLEQEEKFEPGETTLDFLIRTTDKEEWRCAQVASKFKLGPEHVNTEVLGLSGGYQMRVKLSSMLLKEPNLLLLDEPTNYLDLSTLLLLENFLKSYNGAYLIISHDREFLKNTCNMTLDVERGELVLFPQPLDIYLEYKAQQIITKENYNKNVERKKAHMQSFVDRFRVKARMASQAQSRLKQIKKLEKVEIPEALQSAHIKIPKVVARKGLALDTKDLAIGYGDTAVASSINFEITRGEKIAILGDNGQGKTTLMRTVVGEIEKVSGKYFWREDIKIAFYAQHIPSAMNEDEKIETYLERASGASANSEDILRMAGSFLFSKDDIKKKIGVLSGGERARLCLAGMLLTESNVLIFDEPTNHLDFETVDALSGALKECNATVLFISHNRTFVNNLATGIIEVNNGKVTRYPHNYEEYVYHIAEKNKEGSTDNKEESQDEINKQQEKEKRRQFHEDRKTLQAKCRKLEATIEKTEIKKEKLLEEFAADPNNYSQDRNKKLNELTTTLEAIEEEWMSSLEAVHKLEENLK